MGKRARERRREREAETWRWQDGEAINAYVDDAVPWSGPLSANSHFRDWVQTCPLDQWVTYEGPEFSAQVYVKKRPERDQQPETS